MGVSRFARPERSGCLGWGVRFGQEVTTNDLMGSGQGSTISKSSGWTAAGSMVAGGQPASRLAVLASSVAGGHQQPHHELECLSGGIEPWVRGVNHE